MAGNDWIHTRRGVTLVEGTLPKLARALEGLTVELKRFNDTQSPSLTYGQGCECSTCLWLRESEAIANEGEE